MTGARSCRLLRFGTLVKTLAANSAQCSGGWAAGKTPLTLLHAKSTSSGGKGVRGVGKLGMRLALRKFAGADNGSIAIIFAAVMIPVMGIVAAAIDFGRAAKVRSSLQTAASAAAQSGSMHLGEGRDAVERQVRSMLTANLPPHLAGLPHRLAVASDLSSVEVVMETTVPTTLMGVLGVAELPVEATGFATRPRPAPAQADQIAGAGADGAPGNAVIERAVDALLGGSMPSSPNGAEHPILPSLHNTADLEQMARQATNQLRDLQDGLPPEAAAEVERMLRQLGQMQR